MREWPPPHPTGLLSLRSPPLARWNQVVELVEQKKDLLSSILRIQNYLLECKEMKAQIREKRQAVESTQYNGSDLGSVLSLQRRLSTTEAALLLLEPRLVGLQQEGEGLANAHPAQAVEILLHFEEISEEWEALKRTLQGWEDSLTVASRSAGGPGEGRSGKQPPCLSARPDLPPSPPPPGCSSSSRTWTAS